MAHFLLTGHTGFKGAWMLLLLDQLGHKVSGLALDPLPGSLFLRANLGDILQQDVRLDIREKDKVSKVISQMAPDFVIHLAAQPLVTIGYSEPRLTFETNVQGTLNLLEATQQLGRGSNRLIVTSDKVYLNDGRFQGYREDDRLGGRDPYSASKAMADILSQSWFHSFPGVPSSIARAGNVVGGGDIAENRLIPDLVRAMESGETLTLRYPEAVRPWQHVLDCLSGYLSIVTELDSDLEGQAWNVGPDSESIVAVRDVVSAFAEFWGTEVSVDLEEGVPLHEEALLTLDSSKLRGASGWENKLDFPTTMSWTVEWEQRVLAGEDPRIVANQQVEKFLHL